MSCKQTLPGSQLIRFMNHRQHKLLFSQLGTTDLDDFLLLDYCNLMFLSRTFGTLLT